MRAIEAFGRERLSKSFFVRDFLYSTIAVHHGMKNLPDDPDTFIAAGRGLCETLLEPLQDRFGRIAIRSAYRSPKVNETGRAKYGSCASNEADYGAHIRDRRTADGRSGATASIVVPAYLDHYDATGEWTPLAWWIHDHLPYGAMCFFKPLCAFNLNGSEAPTKRIENWIEPKRLLTKPGMENHDGDHADLYAHVPLLNGPI